MKVLLFGTGDYYERYKCWFLKEDILALIDNSTVKQNTVIDGIKVLAPECGVKLPFDAIVILSFYVREMRLQLLKLGVKKEQVYHFYELFKLINKEKMCRPVKYFEKNQKFVEPLAARKKVLLLSHDLTLGGPAIALFYAGNVLVKRGYEVTYASMLDGPLRETLVSSGMKVVVDENLMVNTMKETRWIEGSSLIVCNTINFHVFLSERSKGIPVIWWLHDSSFFYDGIDKRVFEIIDWRNLKVCSVGKVPKNAIQKFVPSILPDNLLYGVEDIDSELPEKNNAEKGLMFVTIGYIEKRKGQDILLQAIRQLPEDVRENVRFCLVGQDSSVMAQRIKEEIKYMPDIFLTGIVGRDDICEILNRADVLICPSREDPMPTVAAEAMMHSVPCIVSDVTGTADYINNGVDGLIFHNEDSKELAEKIKWCIKNQEKLRDIGVGSRKIYDRFFSMRVFEKNFLNVVDSNISEE